MEVIYYVVNQDTWSKWLVSEKNTEFQKDK